MKRTICALVAIALGSLIAATPALAVDGQVAITQARAMAGGVTPGDAPGFPVSINLPGSYVLSSGLTVPDANTNAIVINADHVTVDLNGFAILGPTDCSGGLDPCANEGFGTASSLLPFASTSLSVAARSRAWDVMALISSGIRTLSSICMFAAMAPAACRWWQAQMKVEASYSTTLCSGMVRTALLLTWGSSPTTPSTRIVATEYL